MLCRVLNTFQLPYLMVCLIMSIIKKLQESMSGIIMVGRIVQNVASLLVQKIPFALIKKNFGYDFTGYGVSIVSFTDRKNNNINDVIILRGKFVNQTTQEIIYVSTPKSDIDRVKNTLKEKVGM